MPRIIKIGISQLSSTTDKNENLRKIRQVIDKSSADVVIFPEYAMADLSLVSPDKVREIAEPLDGPFISTVSEFAAKKSMYVIINFFEKEGQRIFNTNALISSKGEVLGTYSKTHLFDAYSFKESLFFSPGKRPSPVFDIKGIKIAMSICFDIRFPELYRIYAINGAEITFISAAWFKGPLKEETLAFLARTRAHENVFFVVVASHYGQNYVGRSMVVDPYGVVVSELGFGEKYAEVEIDADHVLEARNVLPLLKLRRTDLYG